MAQPDSFPKRRRGHFIDRSILGMVVGSAGERYRSVLDKEGKKKGH